MKPIIRLGTIFVAFVTIVSECSAGLTNVALNKQVYHSCLVSWDKNSVLTDGSMDSQNYEVMDLNCKEKELIRFNVIISGRKDIKSVTVYSGNCTDCDGLLNNFVVKLFSNSKKIIECGQYRGEVLAPGEPMTVDCDLEKAKDESILMVGIFPNSDQMNVSTKSVVSEIEILLEEIEIDTSNIALKMSAYLSCVVSPEKDAAVTDGSLNPERYDVIAVSCKEKELVRINVIIPMSKFVGSVTVYSGNCPDCDGLLDNFVVRLLTRKSKMIHCGEYTGTFLEPGKPMRVNCDLEKASDEPIIMVGILPNAHKMNVSTNSAVSEIEVRLADYYMDNGYYGCYGEFPAQKVDKGKLTCKQACWLRDDSFMSSDIDGVCSCGSQVPKVIMASNLCSNFCENENILCSVAPDAFPVYIARAPHIYSVGCYSNILADDAINSDSMTPVHCIKHCSMLNKIHSYLMDSTYCFCTDELVGNKTDSDLCNRNCSGAAKSCGGNSAALVYAGCFQRESDAPCTDIYKCKDKDFDEFGICQSSCEEEYVDKYCLSKVVPIPPSRPTTPTTTISRRIPRVTTMKLDEGIPSTGRADDYDQPSSATTRPAPRLVTKKGLGAACLRVLEKIKKSMAKPARSSNDCKKAVEAEDEETFVPFETFLFSLIITVILASGIGFIFGYWYGKMAPQPKESEEKLEEKQEEAEEK